MLNKTSRDSKATILKQSLNKIRIEPHFGLVKGIIDAFKPESALLLGSAPNTANLLYSEVKRLMTVDVETDRYNKNISYLPDKTEFYPKLFPIFDDEIVTGKEGLDLSDLYKRISSFFKDSDLLVIDQPVNISLGALNYFANSSEIIVIRNIDPSIIFNSSFVKYRMIMRYTEVSTLLIKNHVPVGYDAIRDIIYSGNEKYYRSLGIEPSFKFEKA